LRDIADRLQELLPANPEDGNPDQLIEIKLTPRERALAGMALVNHLEMNPDCVWAVPPAVVGTPS
jgi:hypothetical protein